MVCIYCGSPTAVTNSRLQRQLNQVWRRRLCNACNSTFTTHEKVDLGGTVAIKRHAGQLTPFSRDNLFMSIYESCKHRPKAIADAGWLTQTAIAKLRHVISEGTLERDAIVSTVHTILEHFDKPAATVYAAYHPMDKAQQ